MTAQQVIERPITRPNRRTLLFDGFLRSPREQDPIPTVVDPDEAAPAPSSPSKTSGYGPGNASPPAGDPVGLHRRGALLDRLQGFHQAPVKRGFYTLLDSAGVSPEPAPMQEVEDPAFRVVLIDLALVAANPYLPPVSSDSDATDRLAQSIRVHGMLEPLQVLPAPQDMRTGSERYWIVTGEHRRQAALQAGLRHVPAVIKQVSLRAGLQMYLAQNVHTYELNPLDNARVFKALTDEMGMAADQIAERIGAAVEDIEAELSFLGLEEEIQQSLVERRLTPAQARVLLEAPDSEVRRQLWRYALRHRPRAIRMREKLQELAA